MSEADSLQALRERIDALDRQIQMLISERARCAQQVGAIKQAAGVTGRFGIEHAFVDRARRGGGLVTECRHQSRVTRMTSSREVTPPCTQR